MQMSILNTATTEQMGYGMVSFFVCFHLMNRNPFQNFTLDFYELFIFLPAVLLIFQCDILWCYANCMFASGQLKEGEMYDVDFDHQFIELPRARGRPRPNPSDRSDCQARNRLLKP